MEAAGKIGYPVFLKASAGGGGKGIRLVEHPEEMERAFQTASNEAEKAFGDGRMYMEKYLNPVKHIEVQLLADEKGNTCLLYTSTNSPRSMPRRNTVQFPMRSWKSWAAARCTVRLWRGTKRPAIFWQARFPA